MRPPVSGDNYTYAETNYANPHAPTAFFNGSATTTYAYDANGNLTGMTGAATSSFMWDYRNRMLSAWVAGATSTYAYDHTTARMLQATPTTTTHYPSKFYSVEYAGVSTTTGTSTSWIFRGDTLVAYIEQAIADGQATGTPTTYYVHPDHLGSTNVVTNAGGTVVEALDYYPYGAERIHTGSADADRTFIGQFGDDPTSLSYLNARYYDGGRGQFLSQDPVHLALGNAAQVRELAKQEQGNYLSEPQLLNSYSYSKGNPITLKDPEGLTTLADVYYGRASWDDYSVDVGSGAMIMAQGSPGWNFAFDNPRTTGAIVAVGSIPALMSGGSAAAAFQMAAYPGVGAAFAAQQTFAGLVYSTLAVGNTLAIPQTVSQFSAATPSRPSSYYPVAWSLTKNVGPSVVGGYTGAIADAIQFGGTIGSASINKTSSSVPRTQSGGNTTKNGGILQAGPTGKKIDWGRLNIKK